jgi:LMBR1 domain-containing protein 1
MCILLLLGLVLRPDQSVGLERGKEVEWVKSLFDVEHLGEQALAFCISIILSLGSCLWFFYGSYGLAALPFYLIKGTKSLEEEKSEVDNDLSRLREKYRAIQEKYARSHSKISKTD